MQAEEAIAQEAEAAKAATRSYPSPPTAILGFAPRAPASANNRTPASGKHSWPADFFDNISKANKSRHQITSSQHSSEGNAVPMLANAESVDGGTVSSHAASGDSLGVAGDENGDGNDYGAAWRDAAQSPAASPSVAPAAATGTLVGQSKLQPRCSTFDKLTALTIQLFLQLTNQIRIPQRGGIHTLCSWRLSHLWFSITTFALH